MSSRDAKNPNGGVNAEHVIEPPDPDEYPQLWEFIYYPYGSIGSVKRPMRTRMRGVVGAGGEKPPAIRLCHDPSIALIYKIRLEMRSKHFLFSLSHVIEQKSLNIFSARF